MADSAAVGVAGQPPIYMMAGQPRSTAILLPGSGSCGQPVCQHESCPEELLGFLRFRVPQAAVARADFR